MARSHLRSVESDPSDPANSRNTQDSSNCSAAAPPDSPRWVPVALALALVVTLALLVWSRLQMGDQISSMQGQIADLEAQVAERDELILAQDRRINDVRTDINQLHDLVNAPLSP